VEAGGPDVDVGTLCVFVAQPFDSLLDLDAALPFPKDHLADGALAAEVEALRSPPRPAESAPGVPRSRRRLGTPRSAERSMLEVAV